MNEEIMFRVLSECKILLRRNLKKEEVSIIYNTIKNINCKNIVPEQIARIIIKKMFNGNIVNSQTESMTSNAPRSINIHDFLSQEITKTDTPDVVHKLDQTTITTNISKIFDIDSITKLQLLINPSSLYIRNYILLDSYYRSRELNNANRFQWKYTTGFDSGDGFVRTKEPIRNLISMKMYQPMMPNININWQNGRMSILIEEFASQAFVATDSRKYHFLLRPVYSYSTTNVLECQIDDFGDGEYKFTKPITEFSTLTLSFGDPNTLISFKPDRITGNVVSYGNPNIEVSFSDVSNVNVGDYVTISTFTTGNVLADAALIKTINNRWPIVGTVGSNYYVNVGTDTTTIVSPIPNTQIQVQLDNPRFIIPIEFTSIKM